MLEELIKNYKNMKKDISLLNERVKAMREVIIKEMIATDTKTLYTQFGSATLTHPKSFDEYECKTNNPSSFREFAVTKIITTEIEEFNKKGFKKKYPELYSKYEISLTPRLSIK